MKRGWHWFKPQGSLPVYIGILLFMVLSLPLEAQVRTVPSSGRSFGQGGGSMGGRPVGSGALGPGTTAMADSTGVQGDTSATKGLMYVKEVPDSVLRLKVFLFHHRPAQVWIDQLWNPTLDPTGVQFHDPLDAINGNYYLGKGTLGHPHVSLFPTLDARLQMRLRPDLYRGYGFRFDNIDFYQTLTPFSTVSYGGSLADDHSLQVSHTQNIMPGWNVAFNYRLYNPEGVYTSSGALNNYLSATTNYFSRDARLQARAALIWQAYNIDENGGLSADSIFTLRLQDNRAGIPVRLSGAGTTERTLAAMGRVTYSLERQSDTYRHRDSIVAVQVNDSTTRFDTIVLVDTIPLGRPHVINAGVVGLEVDHNRQKRVMTDSTEWQEQTASLYWTNDAYLPHRWRNPLRVTLGIHPRHVRAVIFGDTLQDASIINPFVHAKLSIGRVGVTLEAEQYAHPWSQQQHDRRVSALAKVDFDSAALTYATVAAVLEDKAPYLLMVHDHMNLHSGALLKNQTTQQFALHFKHKEVIDLKADATHLSHHVWYDSTRSLHEGANDLWLLQASLVTRLSLGVMHLDMQQLLQYSTDRDQMPVPLWASKNSLYADFTLFHRTLRAQVGIDVRYHTAYHAPLYDPTLGLFLQQDEIMVGNYVWGDAFITLQVKRASIYVKAGHVNALWETPATYFLLPHYPGQKFGLQWGLTWCFFD